MRPPILWITVGFGAGLWAGLAAFVGWETAGLLLVASLVAHRRTPVAAAAALAGVAGVLWAEAALRERAATCAGEWGRGTWDGAVRSAIVRLRDPAPLSGGVVDADVLAAARCGGVLRLRWPEGAAAAGGSSWVVAGPWAGGGAGDRGVLVVRRLRLVDGEPRGRGGLRDRLATRTAALYGARAPLVDALVIARRAELDSQIRERYVRSGLAHLLSISGLHVGFLAGWLAVLLGRLRLPPRARFGASCALLLAYVWLLGFPAPATRAAIMLALAGVARLRQRVVTPQGIIALAAWTVVVVDPWAVRAVGAWLSVAAVAAVVWAQRAAVRGPLPARVVGPALAAVLLTAPITAYAFGTVAPIGVLANLVAIPLAAVTVPGLMLALFLSWVWPGLAHLFAAGSGLGLALLDRVAQLAAQIPGGHVVTAPGWQAAAVWLAVVAAAWWLWRSPRRAWTIAARLAFVEKRALVCRPGGHSRPSLGASAVRPAIGTALSIALRTNNGIAGNETNFGMINRPRTSKGERHGR